MLLKHDRFAFPLELDSPYQKRTVRAGVIGYRIVSPQNGFKLKLLAFLVVVIVVESGRVHAYLRIIVAMKFAKHQCYLDVGDRKSRATT